MTTELPSAWEWMRVDDLCEVTLGQSPPGSSYNDIGQGIPFFQGKAEFGTTYPSIRKWTTQPKKQASAESVLVSVRAPVGPTNLAPVDCAIGRGLAVLEPRGPVAPQFVLWAIRATENRLVEQSTGSTFDAITGARLREHRIPVPPLADQQRIVAAIEEHFSRLDTIDAGLASAILQTTQLQQRVVDDQLHLADAQSHPLREFLTERLTNGRSCRTAADDDDPVLRLTAVKDGFIDPAETKQGDFGETDPRRFAISPDDFLISRGNGSLHLVGRGGLVAEGAPAVAFPDTMIRARVDESRLSPRYLSLVWHSRQVRLQLESQARTTAGIYKVNQSMIGAVEFPVPPLDIQRRLVRVVEEARHAIVSTAVSLNRCRARSAALRRSILSQAFSGRFVRRYLDH